MSKIKLGITIGDTNGIGPEVIIKTLDNPEILKYFTPIIYGSTKALAYHKNIVHDAAFQYMAIHNFDNVAYHKINVVNCWEGNTEINLGKPSADSGNYANKALQQAVADLKAGHIDGLVTGPINKHSMHLANFPYPGHTEFLTASFDVPESLMMMVSETLKVALVTNHLAVEDIKKNITKEKILTKIDILHKSLVEDFGIEKPVIAVLGLNPHAGDDGVIGSEEEDIIKPAIIEAKKSGKVVVGPFAADGYFGSSQFSKVDATLAMYHDQGLVAFKALSFGKGVNFTAGLPFIRTSPDHGTGYDIAGKNVADESSFRAALFVALDAIRHRLDYTDSNANKLDPKMSRSLEREENA